MAHQISNKTDEKGKKVTLSIFALYLYRTLRNIAIFSMWIIPYIYFFSEREHQFAIKDFIEIMTPVVIFIASMALVRGIWQFFHKRIDKFGTRYGFAAEYDKGNSDKKK